MKAIIEIPMGSIYKYEVDKDSGKLVLDRVLNQSIPYSYGYIPNTLCDDGDPLDVFVMSESPIYPLTEVKIIPVAVLKCTDNGKSDDKILAILEGDKFPEAGTAIIGSYLRSYKTGFIINKTEGRASALEVYEESIALYRASSHK